MKLTVAFAVDLSGFASDALAGTASGTETVPATVAALKNISSEITYDEHTHERCTPGDPSKKAFAYLVLTGMYNPYIHGWPSSSSLIINTFKLSL